jgi:hypothetical protein
MTINAGNFVEPVLRQAKDILYAGIETIMNTIDSEHSSDFVLPSIEKYHIGRTFLVQIFPAIVVWPDSDSGGEYSNDSLYMDLIFTVYIIVQDDDQERLQKKLWRFQEAIIRTLKASSQTDNLGGQVDVFEFAGLKFENPWTSITESGYIDAVGVSFKTHHEEIIS